MPKKEAPLEYLNNYMPAGATGKMLEYLHRNKVHLTITRSRKSILGDYRHATGSDHQGVSVNGTLNNYAFLITLIHETGHLSPLQQYGNRIYSHDMQQKLPEGYLLEDGDMLKLFIDTLHHERI